MSPREAGAKGRQSRSRTEERHLTTIEAHLVAATGEFVGTFLFLYTAYAGHLMAVSQAPSPAATGGISSETVLTITLAYSFSLLVNVWAFYRISGGLFNPAVRSPFHPPVLDAPSQERVLRTDSAK